MKIIINKKVIESKLKIAKKMIDNKSKVADLKGIKLTASGNVLTLECVNNNLGFHKLEIKLQCEVMKEGSCLINFKTFETSIKNCDGDFVEIELIENTLYINGNNFRSKNTIINDGGFAYSIDTDYKKICELNCNEFKECIKKVSVALGEDETRPVLMGYLMEIKNNYMNLTSIDGYRLATNKLYYKNDDEIKYILPGHILNLVSIIKLNKEVEVYESNKYVKFVIDDIELFINVIDGEFINYKQLITKDYNTKVQIKDIKKLHDTLKGFKDVCKNNRHNEIILNIKDDKICIQDLNNTMYNEFKIDTKIGDDLIIAFNLNYLLDGLKNIKGDAELMFTTNVDPLIIKNINYTYLVLPIRVEHIKDKVA